jgi:hypothetical protein
VTAYAAFASYLDRLEDKQLRDAGIVPWACPIPYFGRLVTARIATVGLNPSIREFASTAGDELEGSTRRFPTLTSLQLGSWRRADARHVKAIAAACDGYFNNNPYQRWFNVLETLLSHGEHSYYGDFATACHLDLVPFATTSRWGDLAPEHRRQLLHAGSDHLGNLVSHAPIKMLILNGRSVIRHFSSISDAIFETTPSDSWRLAGRAQRAVPGVAYTGTATRIGSVSLESPIRVIGFNHNLQSSFGVSRRVIGAIGKWVSSAASEFRE